MGSVSPMMSIQAQTGRGGQRTGPPGGFDGNFRDRKRGGQGGMANGASPRRRDVDSAFSGMGQPSEAYPGDTGWSMPQSKYQNRPEGLTPNYISDVDIDMNWFTPFQPVYPFGPPYVTYPREWDYPVGINLEYQPRRMELFAMLREFRESSGVVSGIIERRKDRKSVV